LPQIITIAWRVAVGRVRPTPTSLSDFPAAHRAGWKRSRIGDENSRSARYKFPASWHREFGRNALILHVIGWP
jgi:hypothetical protein